MNQNLKLFYTNEIQREVVREFLVQTLKEMAVERVFDKKAVAGIYEGKKAIDLAFEKLEELYGIIKPQVIESNR